MKLVIKMQPKPIAQPQPYLIGETAYNHEGDFDYLLKMVDEIAELNINAIKFHLLLNPRSYMQEDHPLIQKLENWIFSEQQWNKIIEYSLERQLDVIALCDDIESIDYLLTTKMDINSIELHAVSLNDYHMLDRVTEFDKRIILGIGGSTLDEIDYATRFLKNKGVRDILLMYGFQSYPTDYNKINISKMIKIRDLFDLEVGYADHTAFNDPNNELISILPAAMGFSILEKHYTPDYGNERVDYHAAVGKEQMTKIVSMMKIALSVYGNESVDMSLAELNYGNVGPMKKAIVAKKEILEGEELTFENMQFKRTNEESYIKQNQFLRLIGLTTNTHIRKDEIIDFSKVKYEFKEITEEDFTKVGKNE